MSEVKVPEGYKQTEVGVIPEDWEVVSLGDAVEFLDGQRRPIKYSERTKISGIYPYYGASGIVDHVNDYIFDEELILLGEDGENILSRNLPLAFKVTGKIWVNNHAHVMRPNDNFNTTFLTDFLESLDYSLLNSGSAQPKLNKASCLKIKVVKPSKQEQTAIATALSDVDNLIQSLEKLIAKKEAIKTGTMQQLLTGKTRLPEFATRENGSAKGFKQTELGRIPEDWEVSTLGDIANFLKGSGLPKSDLVDDGQYKCIHYGQLFTLYEELISKVKSSTNIDGNIKSISNDVLMPTSDVTPNGLATASCILEKDVVLGGDILIIRANPQILNGVYFAYLINIYREQVMRLVTGSTVYHLYGNTMSKLTINLPNAKEQTAIATILSDMDKEIQALQQRLEKTKGIKQGMMQQLLTGKVRLAH